MPPMKRADIEKQAWSWVETTLPEDIKREHLEAAYKLTLKKCKNCRRNCSANPKCLTGLGEDKYMKSQSAKATSLEGILTELRDPTQYVGLENLGATCYVNSLIQVWFHNEDMRRIIYKWKIDADPEEREAKTKSENSEETYYPCTVVGQLQFVFAMMQFGNKKRLDPYNLAIALSLDTSTQQDAQEFSKLLLCHIEEKLQQNRELIKMLQKLTQGKYSYINCCMTCGTEHPTSTTFYELDLQLAPTLSEALEKYLSEEKLTGINQYFCTTCNAKKDARRFIRLDSLPDTLNIQLLRFLFIRASSQKKKLNSYIQFPEVLDMSEYLKCPPQTHVYNLVAVLSHKGPHANSGHYSVNICNSAGEWHQFSDDKVEKINPKRMEDETTEDLKATKRAKVPKGFISSNTAYMLVYKRAEVLEISAATVTKLEGISKDSDFLRKGKRKVTNGSKTTILSSTCSPKKFKSDSTKIESSEIEKNEELKSATIDYGALNGDAHRMMGCGERDAYEEMEFDKWEVSKTLREIVKHENINHELSLLALQEKKQQEIKGQNKKRELVIQFYDIVKQTEEYSEYYWVSSEWLAKWLNVQTPSDKIVSIDNSNLLCMHHKLDPLKVSRVKCLPTSCADLLFSEYGCTLKLDHNYLCETCVKRRCKLLRFKKDLERDHKKVSELIRNMKEQNDGSFIIGTASLQCWRRLAMERFQDEMQSLMSVDEHDSSEENKVDKETDEAIKDVDNFSKDAENSSKDTDNVSKDTDHSEENEIINFNEDLLCEHSNLSTPNSGRKIIPCEAWEIIRKYFPDSNEYRIGSPVCPICEAKLESDQKSREDDKVNAKIQKDDLVNVYYARSRYNFTDDDPDQQFYIIEKKFIDTWRSFIRYVDHYSKMPPTGIQNVNLLCKAHKGFLYSPELTSHLYVIVSPEEWEKLMKYYKADYEITLRKNGNSLCTNPDVCHSCMLERLEKERLESLKYDRASIYIRFLDENDEKPTTENDDEGSSKKAKSNFARPSRMRRKVKDSHELKVSSSMTLKDVKVMAMQICGAAPYDQHLILDDYELTDDNQTLESLRIFPDAVLVLKVDAPVESGSDVEGDAANADPTSPEKGFKGTELIR